MSQLPSIKLTLESTPQISSSVPVIKDATSSSFNLLIEPTKLQIEMVNVIPDLLLLAMQVGWQPLVPGPIDERLRHPAEGCILLQLGIPEGAQPVKQTAGVTWIDVEPAKARLRTTQHQTPR